MISPVEVLVKVAGQECLRVDLSLGIFGLFPDDDGDDDEDDDDGDNDDGDDDGGNAGVTTEQN